MPISPEVADAISKLPALGLLVFAFALVLVGLARKWWVPGWLYKQDHDGRIVAETQAALTATALQANNVSMARLVTELAAVRRELKVIRDDLRDLSATRDPA